MRRRRNRGEKETDVRWRRERRDRGDREEKEETEERRRERRDREVYNFFRNKQ